MKAAEHTGPRQLTEDAPFVDDRELLVGLRAAVPEAYETLVRRHAGRMLAVAHRILHCKEDAADAVQEAFIAAFRGIESFKGNASLATWLHRIVVNTSLAKRRSQARHQSVSMEHLLPRFDETGHHTQRFHSWSDEAFSRLASAETRAFVRECIDRLPTKYREVLLLRDIEECDVEQTGELLGISRANVKTRLHRARQALRTLLEPIVSNGM
jgi:RNA polymerase sigma-70 factor (ECF subfamily)